MVSVPGPTGQRREDGAAIRRSGKMRGHVCRRSPSRALHPARRARCTWATPARRCSAGSRRGPRAVASYCASKTPMPSAARTRCSQRQLDELRWLGLDLGRRSGRRWCRTGPYRQSERGVRLRGGAAEARGHAWPDLSVLLLARGAAVLAQDAAGRGSAAAVCAHLRGLSAAEVERRIDSGKTAGDPLPRAGRSHRRVRGPRSRPAAFPVRRHRRLRDPSCRWQRVVLPWQRGRRLRDGHHARLAGRRPPGQHAAPAAAAGGTRHAVARIRPLAAGAGSQRQPAVEARGRGQPHRPSCAGVPAGRDLQLPGPSWPCLRPRRLARDGPARVALRPLAHQPFGRAFRRSAVAALAARSRDALDRCADRAVAGRAPRCVAGGRGAQLRSSRW